MAKKVFSMTPSSAEKVETMTMEDVDKFLKKDDYDHLRKQIWHKDITDQKFTTALLDVEKTIEKLKAEKQDVPPVTLFKPWEDRLAIYPDKIEIMTKSGLYKPTNMQIEKPNCGTVVAVGPGKEGKPMPVSVGMRVYYGKYAGTPIPASETDTREILIVRYGDTFGEV